VAREDTNKEIAQEDQAALQGPDLDQDQAHTLAEALQGAEVVEDIKEGLVTMKREKAVGKKGNTGIADLVAKVNLRANQLPVKKERVEAEAIMAAKAKAILKIKRAIAEANHLSQVQDQGIKALIRLQQMGHHPKLMAMGKVIQKINLL
jgi:hypothetical protein